MHNYCGVHAFDSAMVFAGPQATMNGCFNATSGEYNGPRACGFDQLAGEMWFNRAKQRLVANGVALLVLNPITSDEWDWDTQDTRHEDVPFLRQLFAEIRAGTFGGLGPNAIDLGTVIPAGYSAGAQVTSWLVQLKASGDPLLNDVGIAGTVMLSGGTYLCYAMPPLAIAQCTSCSLEDPPRGTYAGCSDAVVAGGGVPSCDFCCPMNFTEQWYHDHPAEYPSHPPAFLAQLRTIDKNADLCAARNYHETMRAHGAPSTLVIAPEGTETCFCVGQTDDPSAAGSPFTDRCSLFAPYANCSSRGEGVQACCQPHATGFAAMVEPLVDFVLGLVGR